MASILLIDDDSELSEFLRGELELHGHAVDCLDRAEHGPEQLARTPSHLVLLDNKMPGMSGIEFLEALRARGIEVPVILMTGFADSDTPIKAMNLGAFDYVVKPDTFQKLVHELTPLIQSALELAHSTKVVRVAATPPPKPSDAPTFVVGKSRAMVKICKDIGLFARNTDAIMILGETGTGKELVARAIHTNSPRKGKPFVALNCAAIHENLLESELFGHEKGAFTHAEKLRKGKIEYANGGTLFLDEIGDMPVGLQAKLLRVLEYQEVERLGSNEPIKVDVRLISATHRDIETAINEGKFRRDLYFRLNRVTLRLPSLRERLEDLPELIDYFLARAVEASGRPRPTVAVETLERLRAHRWPGNVRELQNAIFRAVGACRGSQLLPSHLDFSSENPEHGVAVGEGDARAALQRAIAWAWDAEREELWPLLRDLLEEELLRTARDRLKGNQTQIADRLGMARGTVITRMKDYDLK